MPQYLDSCVNSLVASGYSKSSAYAMCTQRGGAGDSPGWAKGAAGKLAMAKGRGTLGGDGNGNGDYDLQPPLGTFPAAAIDGEVPLGTIPQTMLDIITGDEIPSWQTGAFPEAVAGQIGSLLNPDPDIDISDPVGGFAGGAISQIGNLLSPGPVALDPVATPAVPASVIKRGTKKVSGVGTSKLASVKLRTQQKARRAGNISRGGVVKRRRVKSSR